MLRKTDIIVCYVILFFLSVIFSAFPNFYFHLHGNRITPANVHTITSFQTVLLKQLLSSLVTQQLVLIILGRKNRAENLSTLKPRHIVAEKTTKITCVTLSVGKRNAR